MANLGTMKAYVCILQVVDFGHVTARVDTGLHSESLVFFVTLVFIFVQKSVTDFT